MGNDNKDMQIVIFPNPEGLVFRVGESVYQKHMTPKSMIMFAERVLIAAEKARINMEMAASPDAEKK